MLRTEYAISGWFSGVADAVLQEARLLDAAIPTTADAGTLIAERKAIGRDEWATILSRLMGQQEPALNGILEDATIEIANATWTILNAELGTNVLFDLNDPLVQGIIAQSGDKIRNIADTTLEVFRDKIPPLYDQGLPIDEIAAVVRGIVEETYLNRGRAIARTEVGRSQNTAAVRRFGAAGVKYVEVFDDGFANSHPFCTLVDGKTVTLEWAERNPLQHPNCVRAFGAVFEEPSTIFTDEERWL